MFIVILLMSITLFNFRLGLLKNNSGAWLKGQTLRLAMGVPLCILWVYLTLPALIPFVGYTLFALPLSLNALVTILEETTGANKESKRLKLPGTVSVSIIVVAVVVSLYLNVLVIPIRATALRDVPDVVISHDIAPAMDIEHIRLVPIENARWKAQNAIGQMGTGFRLGDLSIQMVDGKLYWVAPLEFRGLFKWLSFKQSPGFFMVDAENPAAEVKFWSVDMTYTPSAFFGQDLKRHVYGAHRDVLLLEASFEVDDDFKPWYVMSVGLPTVGKTGVVVTGAVLVDPTNGDMEYYELTDVPVWVDQVIPEFVAEKHNSWFGRYVHGFFNSLFTQREVHVPTRYGGKIDVFGIVGPDKHFYWFTGHTSPSKSDDSLMGYTMTNGRTGQITYYKDAVGLFNESAAVSSVNSAVSNFAGWHGAQPLLYNLYGRETYVVPVLSENNMLQAVGLVHARTGHTLVRPTKLEAIVAYRQYLGEGTGDIIPTQVGDLNTIEGVVSRIGSATTSGNTLFYVSLEGSERIFTATASLNAEITLTQVGDRVTLGFLDTTEAVVPLMMFDNLELGAASQ